MRKIRLKIDDLAVDSFKTAGKDAAKAGTVRGYETFWCSEDSGCATCQPGGCPHETSTCFQSCAMTDGYNVCFCS
jgi:hypothetical protein